MLVLSTHSSKTQFENLSTHECRTNEAFSPDNTDFFSRQICICPGKENLGSEIDQPTRTLVKSIFDEVRTLRNKVVHRWGFKDIEQRELREIFERLGEPMGYHTEDETFFSEAAFVFVRLYARTNAIRIQLSYFVEREAVKEERRERGIVD